VRGKQIAFSPRDNEKVMGLSQIGFHLTRNADLALSSPAKRMQIIKDFQSSALFHGFECISEYSDASILLIKNPSVSFVREVYQVLEAFADPILINVVNTLLKKVEKKGKSDA